MPSPLTLADSVYMKSAITMDYTAGDFSFGEVALYSGSICFAVSANSTLLNKLKKQGSSQGNSIKLELLIDVSGANFDSWTAVAETSNQFQAAVLQSLDQLPQAIGAQPNYYVIRGLNHLQPSFLSYTDRNGLWNFDAYLTPQMDEIPIEEAGPDSLSISIDDWNPDLAPTYLGKVIVQISSGGQSGVCRYVSSATISNDGLLVHLGLSAPLNIVPENGSTLIFYTREALNPPELPIATHDSAGMVKPNDDFTIELDGTLGLDKTYVQTVNGESPDSNGNVQIQAAIPLETFPFAASSQWDVQHDRGTDNYLLNLYDDTGRPILAEHFPVNSDLVRVVFTTPQAGKAVILFSDPLN